MVLVETEQSGLWSGDNEDSIVRHAERINENPGGVEKVMMVLYVADLRRKAIDYINRSAVNAHTLKVYHFPFNRIPESHTEDGVGEIYSKVVPVASNSDHIVFENDYIWLIVTSNGADEADIADLSFQGSRNMT